VYHGCVWCGTVTNYSTWIRIGYQIYLLWRFISTHITITSFWHTSTKYTLNDLTRIITATLANRRLPPTIIHFEHYTLLIPNTHSRNNSLWIQRLTDFIHFQMLTNWLLCIAFLLQHRAVPMELLAFPLLVAMQPTCTQQYRSGERIHVTIRLRLLGNHATRQYRVVSVSMEVFSFRLPSNDGIRPNTSQYVYIHSVNLSMSREKQLCGVSNASSCLYYTRYCLVIMPLETVQCWSYSACELCIEDSWFYSRLGPNFFMGSVISF
jgi:hypothetical protein